MTLRWRLPVLAVLGIAALMTAGCGLYARLPVVGEVGVSSGSGSGDATPQPAATIDSLASLQDAYVRAVDRVGPSVVEIETSSALGSGVVLDTRGDIVTNAHVVGKAHSFLITDASGKQYHATLVGTDPSQDLAVVRVSSGHLRPATMADSEQVQVGELVLAIGCPLGLQSSVTSGIVSAVNRSATESGPGSEQGVKLRGMVQTSAPINHGNSGGALIDLNGDVIGIPTLGEEDPESGDDAAGIGLAIPSNQVKTVAQKLIG
ncbi:MAG TPA: trypsin-like peptidase domain-containing protein [Candidatus Dormibacteraeota bacterium]|jgi:S1-C subfamily serine protease|nr:trypsin-like peptidase domain-containing protein [Candidatus Dormibacteraeota bacterium]